MGNTKVVRHLVRHSDIDVSIVGPEGTAREVSHIQKLFPKSSLLKHSLQVAMKYGHKGVIELMGGRGKNGYSDIPLSRYTSSDLTKIVACQRLTRKWRSYRRSFYFAGTPESSSCSYFINCRSGCALSHELVD